MEKRSRGYSAAGRHRRRGWFSRLSMWKKFAVCFAAVVMAGTISLAVYAASKLGKINTTQIDTEDIIINDEVRKAAGNRTLGKGYLNVALFGVDSREGKLEDGTLSDCIIVASLNKETREVKMVSVYRDTLLDVGGGMLTKCNAAYSHGGATQAINMLNANLDLDITRYVTVDFAVISEIIDQLGGVEIDLTEEEVYHLNQYVEETAGVAGKSPVYVEHPGLQLLDGVQATTYARIRSTAGGDFTRTERQRLVIEKMVEKIQKSNAVTLNRMIDKLLPRIYTNFSSAEILFYAKDFQKYILGEDAGFPFDKAMDTLPGAGSVVIPADLVSNVVKLHEFLFGDIDYTPSSKVENNSMEIILRAGDVMPMDENSIMDVPEDQGTSWDVQQEFDTGNGWQGTNTRTGGEGFARGEAGVGIIGANPVLGTDRESGADSGDEGAPAPVGDSESENGNSDTNSE